MTTSLKFLTREGYGVKSFSNSRKALEHFSRTNPSFYDLIISDIRMPEINGLELYLSLKAIKNDVKILFASCIELAEEILSVMPGVKREHLIRKPVEQEVFIELVKKPSAKLHRVSRGGKILASRDGVNLNPRSSWGKNTATP